MPSGGLLKSQMLLPGWVVSEPGSGLEMQWGGDTCWRRFGGAFWLLERSFLSGGGRTVFSRVLGLHFLREGRGPPAGELDAVCMKRAATVRVVGQAILADA